MKKNAFVNFSGHSDFDISLGINALRVTCDTFKIGTTFQSTRRDNGKTRADNKSANTARSKYRAASYNRDSRSGLDSKTSERGKHSGCFETLVNDDCRLETPEYRLWASVLFAWLYDAVLGVGYETMHKREEKHIEAYEQMQTEDFDLLCDALGINADAVRKAVDSGEIQGRILSCSHYYVFHG